MDNLHSWLIEKKQKEMILDSSKTKVVMEQEHPALLRVYYKPLKRRSQGCKRKRALTRRITAREPVRMLAGAQTTTR
ncbi:MAG: hypothetical protein MJ174_10975, partial [Treponema sp.]|nr:hypothetical protein [Treponema sp.]